MDATLIAGLGTLLAMASFFGLFKLYGSIAGRAAAKKYKKTREHLEATIKDPMKLKGIIDAMDKANEIFTSSQGEGKMMFVINKMLPTIAKFIPGEADDKAIKDFFQGVYDGYKEELSK